MNLGTIKTKSLVQKSCTYCHQIIGGKLYYWSGQPRLFFETEAHARKWAKSGCRDVYGNETFPGMVTHVDGVKIGRFAVLKSKPRGVFKRGN